MYMYEATTQLPLLVACDYIVRGAWRANSETGCKVSSFVLIPGLPNRFIRVSLKQYKTNEPPVAGEVARYECL